MNRNLIISLAILLIVGFAGYFYVTRDRVSDADLLVGVPVQNVASVDGDLLSALSDLRTLRLDDTIFSNPKFNSFQNFSTTIQPQPAGRQNPFAPLSALAPVGQSTDSTSPEPGQ